MTVITCLSELCSCSTSMCCGLLSRFSRLRWHSESSIIVKTQRIWGANFAGSHDTSSAAASDESNYTWNSLSKFPILNQCTPVSLHPWRGGAIGRASDLRLIGRGFESCLGTIVQWPWASYLHLCASVTKQYITRYPSKGGCLATGSITDKTKVRVWVAGKTVWSPCYARAVSVCPLLSCVIACCCWAVWLDYNRGSLLLCTQNIDRVKHPQIQRELNRGMK